MANLYRHSDPGAPNFNPATGEGLLGILSWALQKEGWSVRPAPEPPVMTALKAYDAAWGTDYEHDIRNQLSISRATLETTFLDAQRLAHLFTGLGLDAAQVSRLLPDLPERLSAVRAQIAANLAVGPDWTRMVPDVNSLLYPWGTGNLSPVTDAIDLFGHVSVPDEPEVALIATDPANPGLRHPMVIRTESVWRGDVLYRAKFSEGGAGGGFEWEATPFVRVPNPNVTAVSSTAVWPKIVANLSRAGDGRRDWTRGPQSLTADDLAAVIEAVEPNPETICLTLERQKDHRAILDCAADIRRNLAEGRAWRENARSAFPFGAVLLGLGIRFEAHDLGEAAGVSPEGCEPYAPQWDFSGLIEHPECLEFDDPILQARARTFIREPSEGGFETVGALSEAELYRLLEARGGVAYLRGTVIPACRAAEREDIAALLEEAVGSECYWALGHRVEQRLHDGQSAMLSAAEITEVARLFGLEFALERLDLTPPEGGAGTLSIDRVAAHEPDSYGTAYQKAVYHPYVLDGFDFYQESALARLPTRLAARIHANLSADPIRPWHSGMNAAEIVETAERMKSVESAFALLIRRALTAPLRARVDQNLTAGSSWSAGLARAEIEAALKAAGIDFDSLLARMPEETRIKLLANIAGNLPLSEGLTNADFSAMNAAGLSDAINLAEFRAKLPPELYLKISANVMGGREWFFELSEAEREAALEASGIDAAKLEAPGGRSLALLAPETLAAVETNGAAGLPWETGLSEAALVDLFNARFTPAGGGEMSPAAQSGAFWGILLPELSSALRAKILSNIDRGAPWATGLSEPEALAVAEAAGVAFPVTIGNLKPVEYISSIRTDLWQLWGEDSAPALWALMADGKSFVLLLGRAITTVGGRLDVLKDAHPILHDRIAANLRAGFAWDAGLSAADLETLAFVWMGEVNEASFQYLGLSDSALEMIQKNLFQAEIHRNFTAGRSWDQGFSVARREAALAFWTEIELIPANPDFAAPWLWTRGLSGMELATALSEMGFTLDALDLPDPVDRYYTAFAYGTALDPDREPWFLGVGGIGSSGMSGEPIFDGTNGLLLDGFDNSYAPVEFRAIMNRADSYFHSGSPGMGRPAEPGKPWVLPLQVMRHQFHLADFPRERQGFCVLPFIELVLNWVDPHQTPSGTEIAEGRWIFHTGIRQDRFCVGSLILRRSDIPLRSEA